MPYGVDQAEPPDQAVEASALAKVLQEAVVFLAALRRTCDPRNSTTQPANMRPSSSMLLVNPIRMENGPKRSAMSI